MAENCPDLKANQTFIDLQGRIIGMVDQIAGRHEFYNDSVNNNNARIQQFTDMIVAGLFNFKCAKMLRFASAELQDGDVSSRFNGN